MNIQTIGEALTTALRTTPKKNIPHAGLIQLRSDIAEEMARLIQATPSDRRFSATEIEQALINAATEVQNETQELLDNAEDNNQPLNLSVTFAQRVARQLDIAA